MSTRDLMKMGARVIMACRSSEKVEAVSTYTSFTLSLITTFEFLGTDRIGNIGIDYFLRS